MPTTQACAPSSDIVRLLHAVSFAAEKHRHQRRKDKEASPYINHPIALASVLTGVGGIEDVVVLQAALLHDTVEDTDTTYEELVEQFGQQVADIVMEVTDDKQLEKARRKALQIERAPDTSREAALVKLADKICNLRDVASSPPDRWTLERRQEYFDWARRVVDGLPRVNAPLLAAFDAAFLLRPVAGSSP
jgi:GTP diphosphokinase / guanosine-3',5'-bis(diphosphate) 3'-diphosphatase